MRITDIKIKMADGSGKLLAFVTIIFDDCFAVHDIKIIQTASGQFVAMPTRKMMISCGSCRAKSQVQSRYCTQCGDRLPPEHEALASLGCPRPHTDVAHPVDKRFRQVLHDAILKRYRSQRDQSRPSAPKGQPCVKPRGEEAKAADQARRRSNLS